MVAVLVAWMMKVCAHYFDNLNILSEDHSRIQPNLKGTASAAARVPSLFNCLTIPVASAQ